MINSIYRACEVVEDFFGENPTEEQVLEAWQYLVDTGAAWKLQGWYGRTANELIKAKFITVKNQGS